MVGLMTTLKECADTAAAALVEMLRSAKGAVDATLARYAISWNRGGTVAFGKKALRDSS